MNRAALIGLLSVMVVIPTFGQQECQLAVPTVPGKIMFDQQQEGYLADAIVRNYRATHRVIEDKSLIGPLQKIGARLADNVRDRAMNPEFTLIDLPEANAYTFPGGHIYVTKKLVGIARSEDELAGVLAHELGHALTRQVARDYSEIWKVVLGIDAVGAKDDIEEKFQRVLETYATKSKSLKSVFSREDQEQSDADKVGIMLMVRAGYDAKAYSDFFDRVSETRGKTGNWFSDFFGMTKPDGKRLREIIRNTAPAPKGCSDNGQKMTSAEFSDWRQRVVAYSGFGKEESLPPSTVKRVIADPLRSEVRNLQFSPNGKYLLAQDGASIYVMTREPFKNLFRIDAERAYEAKFTPDSDAIVFETKDERIERWNVAKEEQENSYELHIPRACMQSELSPTGDYLACVQLGEDGQFPMQLAVLEVASGEQVWTKKGVIEPGLTALIAMMFGTRLHILLEFSPDGRYLAGSGSNGQFAYDLTTKSNVQLGKIRHYMEQEFVFIGPDSMLGVSGDQGEKSAILKFPSGESIKQVNTGFGSLYRVAKGDFVIVRPTLHAAAAVLDYDNGQFVITSKTRAIDVYDNNIVSELVNGQLGLFHSPKEPPYAVLDLPKGPITRFTAVAISPDLKYVAYSDWMRGAVWDTSDGKRVHHVRGFRGAYFDTNHGLYAEFPAADSYVSKGAHTKDEYKQFQSKTWKQEQRDKIGAQEVLLPPNTQNFKTISSITNRFDVWQHGPYLLVSERVTPDGKPVEDRELEVRDVTTGTKLWSRKLVGGLTDWYYNISGDTFALVWNLDSKGAKDLIKSDVALRTKVEALHKKKGVEIIEVLNHHTGERRFVIPIDTGERSFLVSDVDVVKDTVMVSDTQDRLVIFDSKGTRKGAVFARRGVLDPSGAWLLAETEPGRVGLISLNDMQQKQTFTFGNKIAYMAFSNDSKRLIVITTDQTFYTFQLS